MPSTPKCQRNCPDTDLEEGLANAPQPSSLNASDNDNDCDVDGDSDIVDDADFQATLATQSHAPSAASVSTNRASSVTPPTAATGLETIELSNDGPSCPIVLALEIVEDEISKSSTLRSAATFNKLKVNDNRSRGDFNLDQGSMISREDSTIFATQVEESEHEGRLVSSGLTGEEEEDRELMRFQPENHDSTPNPIENNHADPFSSPEVAGNIALETSAVIVHEPQELIIFDAFLADLSDDEDDVIIATHFGPTLPWWKVRRIQFILSVLLLFAAANAIAVVLILEGNNEPSTTAAPSSSSADLSLLNSHQPAEQSQILAPKACAEQVTSHAQKIKIGLENPRHPRTAVDGSNMVMAVGDGDSSSSQVVIFYSLMSNGTWLEVSSFHMENVGTPDASVALSGQTAFVGFGDANNFEGVVLVFEQNEFGSWKQVNDPFIRTTVDESRYGFGLRHVAIDGDFSCVVDENDCVLGIGISSCNHNVNIFHRVGKGWVEFDVIAGQYCSISGNMLAVVTFATFSGDTWNIQLHELNAAADGFIPSQEPIIVYDDVLSLELSLNYLVYWDRFQQGAVVYQRQNESAPYSFADQIFVKAPLENQIALHNDVLIVGGDNQTHIFSETKGNWAEALILEQQYRYYEVSSRTLLATNAMSVFSFNFEKCTQEMPTQSPSLLLVPSSSFSPSLESLSSSPISIIPPMPLSSSASTSSSSNVGSSTAPTTCVEEMISNSQRIETSLKDPRYLTMEIDGRTMILVAEDSNGLDYVMFYKSANDGEWQINEVFDLGDLSVGVDVVAAISGNAAFVGFPRAYDHLGNVVVFHRDQAGKWEKVNDPFTIYSPARNWVFGYGVEVYGNLAIVATDNWEDNKILVFRRENNKWVQFDIFNGRCPCSFAGDIIVSLKMDEWYNQVVQLYKYAADTGSFVPLQDSIPTGQVYQLDSSHDYFIYWDTAASWFDGPTSGEKTSNTIMYGRDDGEETFTFSRQFNVSGLNNALSIEDDILVISGQVFSLQNGEWVETIALDRRFDEYKLSGRLLLARTTDVVVSFSMDDCTQEMPTQVPSMSASPSDSPSGSTSITAPLSSVVPSLFPAPSGNSLAPTLSSSPTGSCYQILIFIKYDDFSSEVSWKLFRKDASAGDQLLQSYATTYKIPIYNDSICLLEGTYDFIIYDSAHDGICCKYDTTAFYSLSLDNGVLIRKGGKFGYSESTLFSIPFVPFS